MDEQNKTTSVFSYQWQSVTWGNGTFVAVAGNGFSYQIQTSRDGITWIFRSSASENAWTSVTYGNGVFIAVAGSALNGFFFYTSGQIQVSYDNGTT